MRKRVACHPNASAPFNVWRLIIKQKNLIRAQSNFGCHGGVEIPVGFLASQSARKEGLLESVSDAELLFEIFGTKMFLRRGEETLQPVSAKAISEFQRRIMDLGLYFEPEVGEFLKRPPPLPFRV